MYDKSVRELAMYVSSGCCGSRSGDGDTVYYALAVVGWKSTRCRQGQMELTLIKSPAKG